MAADLTKTDSHLAARCAAVASIGASAIHFAVMPAHWGEWVLSGVFFAALAVFQLAWAFVVWSRLAPWLFAAGIAVNAVAAALWVTAHTHGAPFGPGAGRSEAVNAAGICVLLLQCYVVMGSALAWSRLSQARAVSGFNRAVILLSAQAVMAFAVVAGLVSALAGHQHHHGSAPAEALPAGTPPADTPPAEIQRGHHESAEVGLPVTDMGLRTGGGHHHD